MLRGTHGLLLLLRRVAGAAAAVCCFLAVGVLLVVAVGPRTGRYQVVSVLTASMRPTAPAGSMVVVAPKPARELRTGDIITYAIPVEDHHVITHRVVAIVRGGEHPIVQTKGDANEANDPWVASLDGGTVWTEQFAIPHLGRIINALRSPLAHRLGQAAPLLFVAGLLVKLWGRDTSITSDEALA